MKDAGLSGPQMGGGANAGRRAGTKKEFGATRADDDDEGKLAPYVP